MEAMGAGTESSSFIPIEVEEACTINSEVFSSWSYHTIWFGDFQSKLGVVCPTNNQCIVDSSGVIPVVICETELDTSKLVISNLEVVGESRASDQRTVESRVGQIDGRRE